MITITAEQKEKINLTNRQIEVLNILTDYVLSLYSAGFKVESIKKLIEAETGKNVNYGTLYYFIRKNKKDKKIGIKKITDNENNVDDNPFNLLTQMKGGN